MPDAAKRYQDLQTDREPFLARARHNALLSIPSLMPLEGQGGEAHLYEPYQGLTARGVIHLSSRLLTALLPPGRNFHRLALPASALMAFQGKVDDEIQQDLALTENMIQGEVEQRGWRNITFQSLQQLVVAGNVLEQMMPDNTIRAFRLDQYVVRRDFAGRMIECVVEEILAPEALPIEARPLAAVRPGASDGQKNTKLYTHIRLVTQGGNLRYLVYQEVNGSEVPKSRGTFEFDELPYAALRWSATPGEDYGRSKIEEHIGDVRALEGLEKAMQEGAAMASRNIIMVKQGATGGGLRRKIAKALNGDVLVGDFDQVKMMGFENIRGLQVTENQVTQIRQSISQAFLLGQAGQRDAERVTKAEIDRDIDELEASLGGVFSVLSVDMMSWRLNRLIIQMQRTQKLPAWEKGDIAPVILTGLEALSQERQAQRVRQAFETMAVVPGSENVVDQAKLWSKFFIGLGLPDAVNDKAEIQRREEASTARQALEKAAGPVGAALARGAAPQGAST